MIFYHFVKRIHYRHLNILPKSDQFEERKKCGSGGSMDENTDPAESAIITICDMNVNRSYKFKRYLPL